MKNQNPAKCATMLIRYMQPKLLTSSMITLKPRLNLINSLNQTRLTRSYTRFPRRTPHHSQLHPQSPNSHSSLSNSLRHRRLTAKNFERRAELPEEMCESVVKLACESSVKGGKCVVYLIGTLHDSVESCREVEAVIKFLQPQVVFLELCASRASILTHQNLKDASMLPDSEYRVAFEEAMKCGGKVILGDRPVNITLGRAWGNLSLWQKLKLLYVTLFETSPLLSTENLTRMVKERDVDTQNLVLQELSKEFPTFVEALVHERDKYMSSKLLEVAKEHSSVVAVVGRGHLQGIKKQWKKPVELNELLAMPSRKGAIYAVTVFGVAIVSGLYLSSFK